MIWTSHFMDNKLQNKRLKLLGKQLKCLSTDKQIKGVSHRLRKKEISSCVQDGGTSNRLCKLDKPFTKG